MRNQRWKEGECRWRTDREVIDPSRYEIIQVQKKKDIEPFIMQHHYEHSALPSTRFRFLMLERIGGNDVIVGAANFGVPVHPNVIGNVFPMIEPQVGVELNRLVLLDRIPSNGESFFVAEAFRRLKVQGIEAVVSFSDPVPRRSMDGRVTMPGHWGCVYQALSANYIGRGASGKKRIFKSDGTSFPHRTKTKASTGDVGAAGAIKRLCARGAVAPNHGENIKVWLAHWTEQLTYPISHPGCHKYAWAIHRALRRHIPESLPYPKRVDGVAA